MCQAYEGERDYLWSRDKTTRKRGFEAHNAGVPLSENPELDHPDPQYSDKKQWEYGWLTARDGGSLW